MKIEKLNEDNFIVFLNKLYLKNNKFELKQDFERYFKNLFKILNQFYSIEVLGYYNIKIYCDKVYGYILDIKKEELDFYDYYDDHIDMRIEINDNEKFIFKVSDMSVLGREVLKYCHILKFKHNLYLVPKKTINQYVLGKIIENCTFIYGKSSKQILINAKEIKIKQVFV